MAWLGVKETGVHPYPEKRRRWQRGALTGALDRGWPAPLSSDEAADRRAAEKRRRKNVPRGGGRRRFRPVLVIRYVGFCLVRRLVEIQPGSHLVERIPLNVLNSGFFLLAATSFKG